MKTLEQHLSEYAKYHRDQRNIFTHYIGIPLIVFAFLSLLSRPAFEVTAPVVGALLLSPALFVWVIGNVFYLKLDVKLGLTMVVLTGVLLYIAQPLAQSATWVWLSVSIGIFVGGWILQFVGHHFEGKKTSLCRRYYGASHWTAICGRRAWFRTGFARRASSKN